MNIFGMIISINLIMVVNVISKLMSIIFFSLWSLKVMLRLVEIDFLWSRCSVKGIVLVMKREVRIILSV